jgi:uncharacterized membrane protein (UPF0127 family)
MTTRGTARALGSLLVLAALGLAGCATPPLASIPSIPAGIAALPVATVTIGSMELAVAVADSEAERSAGLSGLTDLAALDGLLVVFPSEVDTRFTMRGTLIPLDIAFIGGDGRVSAIQSMAVCDSEPCPAYSAPAPYRWAVEVPSDGLSGVATGDRFRVEP